MRVEEVQFGASGAEWGRVLAPDLWTNAWCRSLRGLDRVVADDVRFGNEAATVRRMGGSVVKVIRPGLASLADGHAPETVAAEKSVLGRSVAEATAEPMLARRVCPHEPAQFHRARRQAERRHG